MLRTQDIAHRHIRPSSHTICSSSVPVVPTAHGPQGRGGPRRPSIRLPTGKLGRRRRRLAVFTASAALSGTAVPTLRDLFTASRYRRCAYLLTVNIGRP